MGSDGVDAAAAMEPFAKVCPRCGMRYDAAASFCQKDGASLRLKEEDTDPRIGQVLLEQFRIEERIGVGGMGAVYRARQTSLGRDVAIKILHPDLARNPDAVRRFQREARISTALDHPNVVRVFLFGQLPDGSLYLVMELLRGRTLAELLRVERGLAVHRALHIATQTCDGVGEAHAQGIVHRDVKPENIFLVTKGRDPDFVKVLDFGIARILHGEDPTQATQSGLVFGTARYISPEGAAGEHTDARSDVYSLGVLTYQLLTGETPFDASAPVQLLMKHIHEAPPHLKTRAGGRHVPDAIADVVMRALTKNPEGRYDDASELAEVLRGAAQRAGLDVVRMRSGAASIGSVAGATASERRDPSGPMIRDGRASQVPRTMMMPESSGTIVPSGTLSAAPSPFDGGTQDLGIPGLRGPRRRGGRSPLGTIGIAFVIGALAVAGGVFAVRALTAPDPIVVEAEDLVRRSEAALAAGHLDGSGEETVHALTDRLLVIRPNDADALRMRRAAADALIAEGATAETAGDHDSALDHYRRALALFEDDAGARDAIARIEQARAVPPREAGILIAPAPIAGGAVLITATVPDDVIIQASARPRFVIVRGTRRLAGPIIAAPGSAVGTWTASYTFASSGQHRIKFVSGSNEVDHFEVSTEIEVARGARTPSSGGGNPPPITTQGSLGPFGPFVPTIVDAPLIGPSQQVAASQPQQQLGAIQQQAVQPEILPLGPRPFEPAQTNGLPPPPVPWVSE